jgi:anaerobic ribonucleoside-triphosphate reductase activating protein
MNSQPSAASNTRSTRRSGDIVLHRFVARTAVEGPGLRAAVWVQGCPIRCPGCFNPQTWARDGGERISVTDLADRILAEPGIEGVSFLGGEPFTQAAQLATVGVRCHKAGLSVITFSGYDADHLVRSNRADWQALLGVTDVLLAGPFRQDQLDLSRPWVGSRNQRFVYLTNRYQDLENPDKACSTVEIHLEPSGQLQINGMIDSAGITNLEKELAAFGLRSLLCGSIQDQYPQETKTEPSPATMPIPEFDQHFEPNEAHLAQQVPVS